ncbi:homoserine dehydrogenase [Xylanimonas protaetiae]|uniref:Homoserine dehydrogenase n=1 Tax=Xylanimonas protaetiae TaxID=2509457 RepID=A0A4P6FE03_9MICO|nr:homoserine dehydrogenase [Xylanimonas protaetiae]QAY68828.1 homoserine dehydrogenase [Xylanimonas protaetiae]
MPETSSPAPVRVALLGCGVVGSQVALGIVTNPIDLAARVGAPVELVGIAVRSVDQELDARIPRALLTTDPVELAGRADIVVEVMGGIEPARTAILRALRSGAAVVTANKALLAQHGPELFEAADAAGVDLSYEAAVAGAIPIIRPIRESLAGDHVRRILGIVNGTTNFVLDKMASEGLELEQAVKEAQALGFAEADPTADVEGYDAAAKAAILASLAFHTRVSLKDVAREGISGVTAADVEWAKKTGYVIKLLAVAEVLGKVDDGEISVRVHPALVPDTHPLASVRGAFNAVFVEADAAGDLMFYGQGAGGRPTSSAVLGDVVSAARRRLTGGKGLRESKDQRFPVLPPEAAITRYQVRLAVADRPGVLAQVAGVLADHGVSIDTVRQASSHTEDESGAATLIITTHAAREASLATTVDAVAALESVRKIISVLRVEGA